MKVLYIEDSPVLSLMNVEVAGLLCPEAQISHACDFQEAEKLLKTDSAFDLIVSDFCFPEREPHTINGGVDFYELVTQEAPSIPFFFLSASAPEDILYQLWGRDLTIDPHNVFDKDASLSDIIQKVTPNPPETVPAGVPSKPLTPR